MKAKVMAFAIGVSILALGFVLTTCGSLHPAPEVEVSSINPLSVTISDTTTAEEINVYFFNGNRVDAVITSIEGGGFDAPIRTSLFVPYGAHRDSLGNTNFSLVVTYDPAFKRAHQSLIGQSRQLIFRGEDAYGNGKTFSTKAPTNIAFL